MTSAPNRGRRRGAGAAVLVALGLLTGALFLRRPARLAAPPVAEAASPSGEAAAPVPPASPAPAPACAVAPSAAGGASTARPERVYAPPAAELADWLQEREPLNARWRAESGDPSWNQRAASQIAAILTQANLSAGALRDVDCRQTICRFKLHSDSNMHGDVSGMIAASRKVIEQTFLVPRPAEGGGWDIETYMPREGYSLEGWHVGKVTEVTQSGT